MVNTYQHVTDSLTALLKDNDHKVISLRGKWGTGKTRLWKSMEFQPWLQGTPIYVSLFGVSSIKELKLRILESASSSENVAIKNAVDTGTGIVAGIVKKYTGYSAEDGALLWVSSLVKGRLIVIDDLERKHDSLDTNSVMGFIDEYSQHYGARFLILLNLAKLVDDEMWSTLHEKVIDGEIVLEPTALEAFEIASLGRVDNFRDAAQKATSILNLTNIRIIKRILRTLEVIENAGGIADDIYDRWVPSAALLVAVHYRAFDNPPPISFIESYNSFRRQTSGGGERSEHEPAWSKLLGDLGINSVDEFESLIANYLQTGLLDTSALQEIFARYNREFKDGSGYNKRRDFLIAYWWDPFFSEGQLRDQARALIPSLSSASARDASDFISVVEKLGDTALVREALDMWLAAVSSRPEIHTPNSIEFRIDYGQFHSEIGAKLQALVELRHPPLSLQAAVKKIVENRAWGEREIAAFANSTVDEYVTAIRLLRMEELRSFLLEHLGWLRGEAGSTSFENGTRNFAAACKLICQSEPDSRLSFVIRRTFQDHKMVSLLLDEGIDADSSDSPESLGGDNGPPTPAD